MDVPPPTYEEATAPAHQDAAAAALVCDGSGFTSTSVFATSDSTAQYGYVFDDDDDGLATSTSAISHQEVNYGHVYEEEEEGEQRDEGEGASGVVAWESSATRLGVSINGSFIGLINELKQVGLAIGPIIIGYTGKS
ncbi:hypothetical protein PWT90_09768 [Aphanocladium album]|nr:hypothetical protein PWT90_09768 [Aphanocladium album]